MHELRPSVKTIMVLAPAARTTGQDGDNAVNLSGSDSATIIFEIGNWSDGAFVFQLIETDDDPAGSPSPTWSVVAAGDMDGTPPTISSGVNDNGIFAVTYKGSKQYLSVRVTEGSSPAPATGLAFGVTGIVTPTLRPAI